MFFRRYKEIGERKKLGIKLHWFTAPDKAVTEKILGMKKADTVL